MTDSKPLHFYKRLSPWDTVSGNPLGAEGAVRLEPSTCVEAESFALQVLDDSMQPEFRKGCIILVDPTGRVKDGCFVLARTGADKPDDVSSAISNEPAMENLLFRQLKQLPGSNWALEPLNELYKTEETIHCDLNDIVGVIVQRAGVRRRYHKNYDL